MADDLERLVCSSEGEGPSSDFAVSLRERLVAEVAHPTPGFDDGAELLDVIDLRPAVAEERPMTNKTLIAAALAAAIVLIAGLTMVFGDDENGTETIDPVVDGESPDDEPPDEEPLDEEPLPGPPAVEVGPTGAADADAGCGLSDIAQVVGTVDAAGERVEFEVDGGSGCAGLDLQIVATPAVEGLEIRQNVTLDANGTALASDQLFGSRRVAQGWTIELVVPETGGVASIGTFVLDMFCDLDGTAELEVTYVEATHSLDIVFSVDPMCSDQQFAFDRDGRFVSSPRGGWNNYELDENGRIEINEPLRDEVEGRFSIEAMPSGEERRFLAGNVAEVVVEIPS